MANTEIKRNLGRMGAYNVETVFVSKRLLPTVKRWNGSGYDESRMPVLQIRKTVTLADDHGGTVKFESYIYRGQTYCKDSRCKKSISVDEAASELVRMLDVSADYAKHLLSVSASNAIAA